MYDQQRGTDEEPKINISLKYIIWFLFVFQMSCIFLKSDNFQIIKPAHLT